jgi:hypothetical protein
MCISRPHSPADVITAMRRSSANTPQRAGATERKVAMSGRCEKGRPDSVRAPPSRTGSNGGNLDAAGPLDRVDVHRPLFIAGKRCAGAKGRYPFEGQPREPDGTARTSTR